MMAITMCGSQLMGLSLIYNRSASLKLGMVCGLCLYGGLKVWDDVTRCFEFEAVMLWWCYGDSGDDEVGSGLAVTV